MYIKDIATVNIVDNDCEYISDVQAGFVQVTFFLCSAGDKIS